METGHDRATRDRKGGMTETELEWLRAALNEDVEDGRMDGREASDVYLDALCSADPEQRRMSDQARHRFWLAYLATIGFGVAAIAWRAFR